MNWSDYSHTGTCPRCGSEDVQIAISACFDCTTAAEVRDHYMGRIKELDAFAGKRLDEWMQELTNPKDTQRIMELESRLELIRSQRVSYQQHARMWSFDGQCFDSLDEALDDARKAVGYD